MKNQTVDVLLYIPCKTCQLPPCQYQSPDGLSHSYQHTATAVVVLRGKRERGRGEEGEGRRCEFSKAAESVGVSTDHHPLTVRGVHVSRMFHVEERSTHGIVPHHCRQVCTCIHVH